MTRQRNLALLSLLTFSVFTAHAAELPAGAFAQIGNHKLYQGPEISDVAISYDGSLMATTSRKPYFANLDTPASRKEHESIVLWDAVTGDRIREFRTAGQEPRALAISQDNQHLAVGYESNLQIFKANGKGDPRLIKLDHSPHRVFYSSDNKFIYSTSFLDSVTSIENATGRVVKKWSAPEKDTKWLKEREYVDDFVISPDQSHIAWVVDLAPDYSKLPLGSYPPPPIANPHAILITNMKDDKIVLRKDLSRGEVKKLYFSPDGKQFTTGRDKLKTYDTISGKEIAEIKIDKIGEFVPSPDRKQAVIVTGWSDVHLWDLVSFKRLHSLSTGIRWLRPSRWNFSGDGKTLVMNDETTMRVYDVATGKEREFAAHRLPVTPSFSNDGRTLFTSCEETTCHWDLKNLPLKAPTLQRSKAKWESLAWGYANSGKVLLEKGNEQDLRVLDVESGKPIVVLKGTDKTNFASISEDATRVLAWNWIDKGIPQVRLFDAKSGKQTGEFSPEENHGYQPISSHDSRMIAWSYKDGSVRLYDSVTGKLVKTLSVHDTKAKSGWTEDRLLFTSDSRQLIVAMYDHPLFGRRDEGNPFVGKEDGRKKWVTYPICVFDLESGKEVIRFYANPALKDQAEALTCATCSPDNRYLALAEKESGTIRVFDLKTGKIHREYEGHRHGVHALAFSPDGKTLASGGVDNVVYLWDFSRKQ